jgi:hypothetical protein
MATSDRQQFKQVVAGSIGDGRTIAANPMGPGGCVVQDAQRFVEATLAAGLAANTNVNVCLARVDRPVQVKECRILPGAAATLAATPANTVFSLLWTNDNGGTATTLCTINCNTVANGGTGNLAAFTSVVVTQNTAINQIVPSGSMLIGQVLATTPSTALGSFTFQVLWEEV